MGVDRDSSMMAAGLRSLVAAWVVCRWPGRACARLGPPVTCYLNWKYDTTSNRWT